jgi:hypothetical protein
MPDKDLRGMTALSVFFGKFYCSAERLCFAWEICNHMAMSISDLPSAILVHHDISRFVQRFLQIASPSKRAASPPVRSLRNSKRTFNR